MNTHDAYDWEILRSSDKVPDSTWQPHTQTDVIFIDTSCKTTKVSSTAEMRDYLGANDEANKGPIRAAPGMTYDIMEGHAGTWKQGVQTDFGYSLCRRITVQPHPDKQYAFLAEIEISNMGRLRLNTISGDPYAGAPTIRINVQNNLVMKPLFRIQDTESGTNLVIPGDDEVDLTTTPPCFKYTEWIGDGAGSAEVVGKPIDMGGRPMNTPVESRQLQMEVLRRWGHLDWESSGATATDWVDGSGSAFTICLPDWDGRVGSRNIDAQWGFDPGYLKLDAINVLPHHHDFKIYQYIFTYDGHKHAQQFTPVLPGKGVTLDDASITSIRGSNAHEVYWNQPYLNGYRYQEADWSADEWDYLETFTCH